MTAFTSLDTFLSSQLGTIRVISGIIPKFVSLGKNSKGHSLLLWLAPQQHAFFRLCWTWFGEVGYFENNLLLNLQMHLLAIITIVQREHYLILTISTIITSSFL